MNGNFTSETIVRAKPAPDEEERICTLQKVMMTISAKNYAKVKYQQNELS